LSFQIQNCGKKEKERSGGWKRALYVLPKKGKENREKTLGEKGWGRVKSCFAIISPGWLRSPNPRLAKVYALPSGGRRDDQKKAQALHAVPGEDIEGNRKSSPSRKGGKGITTSKKQGKGIEKTTVDLPI